MKIVIVAGARPNFVKLAPLMEELKKHPEVETTLVHTGQHYDDNMSKIFFEELDIPKPDVNLGVGSGTHAWQTAQIMLKFEEFIASKERVDLIVVLGDVNSTLSCALVAAKLGIKVAHIEAGMRSFNLAMPEEINRMLTDKVSDYLFTTEETANENLLREGYSERNIFFVGNIMVDTVQKYAKLAETKSDILDKLQLAPQKYALFTMHRAEITNNKRVFTGVMDTLNKIQENIKIVWPVHPRTRKLLDDLNIKLGRNIILTAPVCYLDILKLMKSAQFIMTDSGGIQSETTCLHVPCLTLREETEHIVTTIHGTNIVVGLNKNKIISKAEKILAKPIDSRITSQIIPPLWDGKTAERIVNILLKKEEKGQNI